MANTMTTQEKNSQKKNIEGQYLIFEAGGQKFALDVFNSKGVISLRRMNILMDMPERIRGIADILGRKAYVIDIGIMLGTSPVKIDDKTCAIIVEYKRGEETREVAIAASNIDRVAFISCKTNDVSNAKIAPYALAQTSRGEVILDIDKLLKDNDFSIAN